MEKNDIEITVKRDGKSLLDDFSTAKCNGVFLLGIIDKGGKEECLSLCDHVSVGQIGTALMNIKAPGFVRNLLAFMNAYAINIMMDEEDEEEKGPVQ